VVCILGLAVALSRWIFGVVKGWVGRSGRKVLRVRGNEMVDM